MPVTWKLQFSNCAVLPQNTTDHIAVLPAIRMDSGRNENRKRDLHFISPKPLTHLASRQVEEEDQVEQPLHQRRHQVLTGEYP